MASRVSSAVFPRQSTTSPIDELLLLLGNPFNSILQQGSLVAGLGTSIGFTVLITIAFSLLRPYNSVVYAPKLKHADDRHAPPPMGRGVFAWFGPLVKTKEADLVELVGLDATIFLRFTRMCRNMFLVIAVLGCGILIPINLIKGIGGTYASSTFIERVTPSNTFGDPNWGQVICAWLFDIVIVSILWWNYRCVLKLRRQYFNSEDYQRSLHARTLMITDLPKEFRGDEGISRVVDQVVPDSSFSRTAIARNVKELPGLIEEHNKTVRQLEKVLAKYLQNPDNLPAARPECKPSKRDPSYGSYPKGQKVDAIEYLTGRIRELELEIKEVRITIDKRNAMPYGFASYEDISEAHAIAYQARNKHPNGTTIVLAPRPHDVIWNNMPLSKSARRWKNNITNFWIVILTLIWVAPNILISIFVANLNNLGLLWPAFHTSLSAHTSWWAIVQGVASPALTSLIFLLLPIMFRRLAIRAGDQTKTSRERHVTSKLYAFFVFNNLIVFCVFNALWTFVANVIKSSDLGLSPWAAIQQADIATLLFLALCNISPFWVTWLLQRNLGAAVDLAQLWTLVWSFFSRKFSSPTPRELIELTAPPAFDYASYYNYFLFYTTVTLCFATIQPLVIPAAALYFAIDVYLKKYLLMYIFITKTESGGMFWRTVFNRMIFATILANLVVFLSVWVRGNTATHIQAYAVVPLPFLMIAFKVFCSRTYDDKIHYFNIRNVPKAPDGPLDPVAKSRKTDRLASRYGHPALYRPLITPMVHARAQNILASIYRGRLTDGNNRDQSDITSNSGYSDTFMLNSMKPGQPGAVKSRGVPGFEVVSETQLDFSYYKNRSEFADEHGGGVIFDQPNDLIDRPGTPSTFRDGPNSPRSGSPAPARRVMTDMSQAAARGGHPAPSPYDGDIGVSRRERDDAPLMRDAAGMPLSPTSRYQSPGPAQGRAPGFLGGGPQGYGGLPQQEAETDTSSYDYFRTRRQNGGWQDWSS